MSTQSAFVLFVPFAPPESLWVVRRARTVVERHASQREALAGARDLAAGMIERMGTDNVRIEVQDENGGWRVVPVFQEVE